VADPEKMLVPLLLPGSALMPKETAVAVRCAGRFILATNVLDIDELTDDDVLREYKRSNPPNVSAFSKTRYLLPVSSSTPQSELRR